ncbi:MAG: lysylphosphatidylglycerol synthase transmembrane domain-containing protein [Bacteroidota bacterium]
MWQSQGNALAAQCTLDGESGDHCRLSTKLLTDFRRVEWMWIVLVCATYMLSNYIRAIRWKDLLRTVDVEVSTFNAVAATMVGYFANVGVPRLGEILRPGILARYDKAPLDRTFGTIVLERIVDVVLFGVMIGLGFLFHYEALWSYLSSNVEIQPSTLITILVLMMVSGVIGILSLRWLLGRREEQLSPFLTKVKGILQGFIDGILSITRLPNLPLFVAQSIGIWVLYFLMHYLAFLSYEPTASLGLLDAILVFDFGALGIVLPSPGGMGTYHFLIVESLDILKVPRADGFSFAMIIFFTLNLGCNVVFGLISLVLLPIVNGKTTSSSTLSTD